MKQFVFWICCLYALSPQAWATYPSPPPSQEALAAKTPLFVANRGQVADLQGQIRPDVWFTSHAKGLKLFFTNKGISYQFIKHEFEYKDERRLPFEIEGSKTSLYRFDMELLGANLQEVEGQELQAYYENFYLAHCHEGILEVPTYTKIVYKNIYPKIDWVISSRDGQIKHDFVVHPGGDPRQIRMQYRGAENLRLDKKGNLHMSTPLGDFSEQAPVSFQGKSKIVTQFALKGEVLGFELGSYDAQKTLVIDPALIWSTYYGGSASDQARRIQSDGASSMYITGHTASTAGIATPGAAQLNLSALTDVFLLKMDLNGNRLWCTYLGGNSDDYGYALAVNPSGIAFVGGQTTSTSGFASGFSPTAIAGNLRGSFAGNTDGFVARFTAAGVRSWCGYLGGIGSDRVNGLAVDASANVYVTGRTTSDSLVVAGGNYTARPGGVDILVGAYAQTSGALQWTTYAGGTSTDEGSSIVHVASLGRVYVAGTTSSTLSLSGAYQNTRAGDADGFLFALNASNGAVTGYSTYYGYAYNDYLEDITFSAVDNSLVVVGTFYTSNAVSMGGPPDCVARVFKLSTGLNSRSWEVVFDEASRGEFGRGVAVDGNGNVYMAGSSEVGTGALPPPALRLRQANQRMGRVKSGNQPNAAGGHEAFLVKYSSNGTLLWKTYHGGSQNDVGFSVATDAINNVYLVGSTESTNNMGINGFLNTYQGGRDVFVAKFNGIDNHLIVPDSSVLQLRLCRGAQVRFPVKRFGIFGGGDSLIVELSNQFGTFTSPVRLGGVLGTATSVTATIPTNTLSGGGYRMRFRSTSPNVTYITGALFIDTTCYVRNPNQDTVCLGTVYTVRPTIIPSSGFSYAWSAGGSGSFVGGLIDVATPNFLTQVSISTAGGASLYAPTISYTGINDRLNLQALTDVYLCNPSDSVTFQMSMTDASSCPACQVDVFRDGVLFESLVGVPRTRTYGTEGTYVVRLNRCGIMSNAIKVDRVNLNPVLTAIPGDTICGGQQTLLMASANATGLVFAWSSPLSGGGASQYITQSGLYTVSVTDTISGCSGVAQRTIVSRTPALDSIRFLPISVSEDTINITRLIFRIYPDSSANLPIQYSSPYITGSAATGFIFYPRLAGVGTHTITCRILQAGCFTEIPATVQVIPAPTVTGLLAAYCANSPNDSLLRSPSYVYSNTSGTVGVEANIMEASITNYNGLFTNQNQNTPNEYFLLEPSRVDSPTALVTVLYRTIVNNYDAFGALISTRSYIVGRASLTINLTTNANVRILDTSYLYCERNEFRRLRVSPAGGKLYIRNLDGAFPNRLDSMTANSLGEVFLNPGLIHANDPNNTTYRLTYSVGLNGCGGQDTLRIVIPRAPDSTFVFRRQDNSLLGNPARVCISSTPIRMIPTTATNAFSGNFPNIPRGFFSVNNVAQAPGDTIFRLTGRTPGTRYGITYTITNSYGCAYNRMDSIIVDSLPVMTNVGVSWPTSLCSYQLPFTVSANNRYLDTLRIFRGNTMIGTTIATAPNTPASIGFTLTTANTLSNQATGTSDTLRIHYRAVTQNGCVDSVNRLIRIHPRPVISMANLDPTYCLSSATTIPLGPNPTGGRFWSVGGNGNLDTLRRTYLPRFLVNNEQIFYSYVNPITQCGDTTFRTVSVVSAGANTLSFQTLPPPTICRLDTLIPIAVVNSAGSLTPGAFTISTNRGLTVTGTGTANINPDSTGEGMVYISYTYQGPICAITTLCSLDIKTKPRVSVIYDVPFNQTVNTQIQVCQSLTDTAELIAYDVRPGFVAPSSIRFTGLKVTGDSISQRYFLRLDSVGVQTVNLSYTDINGCRADTSSSIRILNNPVPILEGVNPFYCVNSPADTILGIPTGGTWATNLPDYVAPGPIYSSFFPRTISGNGGPTTVNLAYNVVYSNGCRNSRTVNIPILARPNLTVVSPFNGQHICSNVAPFQMEVRVDNAITRQGSFSGLGVNNTDWTFNPGVAVGARQLSYVYSDPATGCVDSTTINVVVNQAPVLDSLRLARDYCFSNTPLSITARDLANTGSTFTFGSNPVGVVQQITPTTANVSIATVGPALVSLLATNPLGCRDSINQVINVLSLPQGVTIGFFDTTLCQNQTNVTLNGFPTTNGNDFWIQSRATGNVLISSTSNTIVVNNTVLDNMGYYRAIYQYTDATGCANRDTVDFSVHPNPRADFQQISFCAGDTIRVQDRSNFPLFLNFQDTLRTRQWTFRGNIMQGQTGPQLSLLNEQPGWGSMQLQVTSGAGCSGLISSQTAGPLHLADTIFIYSVPRVNFAETGGCQNDTLLLIPSQLGLQTTVNGVSLDRITQVIWRYGNGDSSVINNPGGINLNRVGYVYRVPGVYFPSLSVTNQGFCTQTTTLRLPISPTINPVNVPYSQDFEASPADWYQSMTDAQAVWQWGPYQGSRLVSGSNVWSTGLGMPYTDSLSTWLFTPCFDLQRSRRPMVKFDYAADMYNFDGVVMEYYDKAANRWRKLGERGKGLNWYNNPSNVFGLLNFTTLGQGVSLDAWTGYNRNLKTARYRLDPFKGQRFVRFRFAFGTLAGVPNTAEREGFILDNFWLGERRRNVLVEHFSNAYYPDMDTINRYVYNYIYNSYNGNDAILVQYQTKDDRDVEDPLFPQAPADYSARKLFYGASEANIAVNGNVYQGPSLTIRQSDLDTIMLLDPDFNIQLEPLNVDPFSGTVDLKAYVTANRNLPQRSYTTYAMIVEDSLSSGPYFVTSVLRKILPMPNGVPMIRPWLVGEQDSIIQTWTVTNAALYNFSRLQAVVFIQSGDNKEVFQVVTSRNVNYTNPPVPIEQIPGEALDQAKEIYNLRLYPNPAQTHFTADFVQPLQGQNYRWRLFDVRGVLLQQDQLASGSQQIQVSVQDLPSGVYIFQVIDPQTGTTAQRQVVVAH